MFAHIFGSNINIYNDKHSKIANYQSMMPISGKWMNECCCCCCYIQMTRDRAWEREKKRTRRHTLIEDGHFFNHAKHFEKCGKIVCVCYLIGKNWSVYNRIEKVGGKRDTKTNQQCLKKSYWINAIWTPVYCKYLNSIATRTSNIRGKIDDK